MKLEFSQRAILISSILFLVGFVSLIFANLNRDYVGIIFICIPVCAITQVIDFEKKLSLHMLSSYALAFAIYNLDSNLYIAKFLGGEKLLNSSGWMHLLGILLVGFECLIISMIIIAICNPKFLNSESKVVVESN